jgi:hypothetical protein
MIYQSGQIITDEFFSDKSRVFQTKHNELCLFFFPVLCNTSKP